MQPKRLSSLLTLSLVVCLLISSCRLNRTPNRPAKEPTPSVAPTQVAEPSSTSAPEALTFQVGRNDYVINVDDTPREFIVYVPVGYDPAKPTPVVFIFHGTNGTGETMYEKTSWVRKADEVTAIVIFPSSWHYFLIKENANSKKWNDAQLSNLTGPTADLKDDVKFTREMLKLVQATFNVDEKRIYASGFSNGGKFVDTRLMIEMNDVFAAFTTSGTGTYFHEEGFAAAMPPKASTSLYSIMGTMEELVSEGYGIPMPFPFEAEDLLTDKVFGGMLVNLATYLNLDPNVYQVLQPRPNYTVFVFDQSLTGADNEFIFQMVKDMIHVYPSGNLYPKELDAADVFWKFFERHPLK